MKTKETSTKGKKIQTKQDILKQRSGRAWHKNLPTTRRQRTERFWTKIWQPKKHNKKAEWINDMTRELKGFEEGPNAEIHIELLKKTLKRYQTRKRQDMMEYMKFTSIHGRLALEMNRCLQVPDWMTKGNNTLIQKDLTKGTAPNNYRPITCLPLMRKILTAQIREEI